ncbi:MAG: ABC transporter permease [Balneolaceae bacterium]|nr:ABC transporter permease [Balneolaceae bacterium]
MLYLRLAWRNIWRNRRRSLITMFSVIVAVLLASVMRSMQEGQYDMMIEGTVGTFVGYIQVQQEGFWDDQTLDNSFVAGDSLLAILNSEKEVSGVVPRIQSFALAAGEEQSRPAMVIGIDVEAELQLINPQEKLRSGTYFSDNNEQAVLLGKDLLSRLQIQVGDSVVMLGQGFRGQSATGLYEVKGTVSVPNAELNKSLVLMPLQTSQYFLAAPNRLTSLSLVVDDPGEIESTIQQLEAKLSAAAYDVMSWEEMLPELQQSIEADRGSSYIIIMILYVVVGFGILGTVLMMITERSYEFGVMISIGTPRMAIAAILGLEILFIALLGSGVGILFSLPVAWYFNINPIEFTGEMAAVMESYSLEPYLPFSLDPSVFYIQAVIIFIITLLFSFIPLLKASKLNPVKAMRS